MAPTVDTSWIALIFVLFLVVGVFASLVLLGVLLLRKNERAAEESGTCGQCGYRVRGLTVFECPECGSDLREVGIVNPKWKSSPWVWVVTIGVSLLLVLLLCVCLGLPVLAKV